MLHIPRTKNEQPLHLPLNDVALGALRMARFRGDGQRSVFRSERTGEPVEHPRHWFAPAPRLAGITGSHWHDLRHTFASRLCMKGTPLEDIADLLGHKSLAMIKQCAHLGPSRLHEVEGRLLEEPQKPGTESGTTQIHDSLNRVINFVN